MLCIKLIEPERATHFQSKSANITIKAVNDIRTANIMNGL